MSTIHPNGHPLDTCLTALTTRAGFDIDTDVLDVIIAHEPDLISTWVHAAACHAATDYVADLLTAPIQYLREETDTDPAGAGGVLAVLHEDLLTRRHMLTGRLARTWAAFTTACHALADTGLLWPGEPTPTGTTLEAILASAHGQALTGLGLRPVAAAGTPAGGLTDGLWFARDDAPRRLRVRLDPCGLLTMTATSNDPPMSTTAVFSPHTPTAMITAAVLAAITAGVTDNEPHWP